MSAPLHGHSIVESVGHEGRGTTCVNVSALDVSGDETTMVLSVLMETLQAVWDKIPVAFRESATVDFRALGDYASMSVDVFFRRPETDEELADRRRWLSSLETDQEERDHREFSRLQQKFKTNI